MICCKKQNKVRILVWFYMGNKNIVSNHYIKKDDVFADIINLAFFGGEPVITAKEVVDMGTSDLEILYRKTPEISSKKKRQYEMISGYRDVLKLIEIGEEPFIARVIVGAENQSNVHYGMPVRLMLYDALQYAKQIKMLQKKHKEDGDKLDSAEFLSGMMKQDRLIPVKTIVISYLPVEWDGARTLHEMLNWEGIPKKIADQISDYHMHLIEPCKLDDNQTDKLKSSFGHVMGFIKYSKDKERLEKYIEGRSDAFRHLEIEAAILLNEFCQVDERLNSISIEEEGEYNMCQAVEEMREEAREEGIREGECLGKVKVLRELDWTVEMIAKQVNLSESEVMNIIQKIEPTQAVSHR